MLPRFVARPIFPSYLGPIYKIFLNKPTFQKLFFVTELTEHVSCCIFTQYLEISPKPGANPEKVVGKLR